MSIPCDVVGVGVDDVEEVVFEVRALSWPIVGVRVVASDGQDALADVAFQEVRAVGEDSVLDAPAGFD